MGVRLVLPLMLAVGIGEACADPAQSALAQKISQCWNVGPDSAVAKVSVHVGFFLARDGRVLGDVQLLSASDASSEDVDVAFAAARRAILRCQGPDGYAVEMADGVVARAIDLTFNPEATRNK